jgi:hypothetical protein
LPLANFRLTVHGAEDSILQLASAFGKKELDVTKGVERHVEWIAVELALGRRMLWRLYTERAIWGVMREEKGAGGEGCSSPMRCSVLTG